MGTILDQMEGRDARIATQEGVRCPFCGAPNTANGQCRHVRWTFERGGPLDFARYLLGASPLTARLGRSAGEVSSQWLQQHGEQVMDLIALHFGIDEGFVFGDLGQMDLMARDLWRLHDGEPVG